MEKIKKIIFITAIVILTADLAYLNYSVLFSKDIQNHPALQGIREDTKQTNKTIHLPFASDSCYPFSCVDLIRQATSSVAKQTTSSNISAALQSVSAKEYYVTFGSGQTGNDQYEDVPGLTAYIDSTKYGKIKSVTFEATIRIPTANGRIYVQLFNATDQHPVWFSEVSAEGTTSQLITSPPITLDSGNKLYKVQAKTTLKYSSLIDQARIHIITQ